MSINRVLILMIGMTIIAAAPVFGAGSQEGPAVSAAPDLITVTAVVRSPEKVSSDQNLLVEKMREGFGIDYQMQLVPAQNLVERLTIMFTGGTFTDELRNINALDFVNRTALGGYLIPIGDYLNQLPNYRRMWGDDWQYAEKRMKAGDGKVYQLPTKPTVVNTTAWIYNKAAFDSLGLDAPETTTELFDVLTAIKRARPDAVPMSSKWGYPGSLAIGLTVAFRTTNGFIYDPDYGEVVYSPATGKYRDMLAYLARLYESDLIEKEFATMTVEQWEQRIARGQTYIEAGWADWAPFFDTLADKGGQTEYDWQPLPYWVENVDDVRPPLMTKGVPVYPWGPIVTQKAVGEKLERLLKWYDWSATDEGLAFHSLGVEGITFTYNENGDPQFMDHIDSAGKGGEQGLRHYGLGYYIGKYLPAEMANPRAVLGIRTHQRWEEQPSFPITIWDFTEAEARTKADNEVNVGDTFQEYALKFIVGQLDVTSDAAWNEYLRMLNGAGIEQLLNVYKTAYTRSR